MKISKELEKEKFKEYNRLYFNRQLRMPRFSTFTSDYSLGQCFYNADPRKRMIRLATNVDWTEQTFREVLVHEMIHLYLYQTIGAKGRFHRKPFMEMQKKLNDEYGLNICIHSSHISFIQPKGMTPWQKFRRFLGI